HAQATSVPGVAQRTGATIYYIEFKRIDSDRPDRRPVFALMPGQGDVDIVIAAELVEAGRAMLRDFVSPDRTMLIASSHRNLTVSEKMVPGDGPVETDIVNLTAVKKARDFICFDMERIAVEHGTVISASLFGALAGSGCLPFPVEAYREVIEASKRGVSQSLAAFDACYLRAQTPELAEAEEQPADKPEPSVPDLIGPKKLIEKLAPLQARITALPVPVQDMATRGLHKVVAYQDLDYGADYLDRLEAAVEGDSLFEEFAYSIAAAKYVANAMVYDDVIRVADLKTQSAARDRVDSEIGGPPDAVIGVIEYFHPRGEEVRSLMPVRLARWFEKSPRAMRLLDRLVNRGRRYRTDRIGPFLLLWLVAGLRRFRRHTYRHAFEAAHLKLWFDLAEETRREDYALGVEILKCHRLIKGYGDTHERGQSKFEQVLSGLELLKGREDAADWLRRLREAALADEEGNALTGALQTVRSFTETGVPKDSA
ncbi:MAG: indolepyruvate oxidoreductase subunit beta family protein, partial [Pseudomonadota bacterium]